MKRKLSSFFSATVVATLLVATIWTSFITNTSLAQTSTTNVVNDFADLELSEGELAEIESLDLTPEQEKEADQLAADLEFLFEDVLTEVDGEYFINDVSKIEDRFGKEGVEPIKKLVLISNGEKPNIQGGNVSALGVGKWSKCVVDSVLSSYELLYKAFVGGAVYRYIDRKEWEKAGKLLAKAMAKAGVKVSGIALGIELSWYAVSCTWKK